MQGNKVGLGICEAERYEKMQDCINRADKFVTDVLPQIGGICLQDYASLNEMCMLLTELKTHE